MFLYTLNTLLGKYINTSINPLITYEEHLNLLKLNKHNCIKLQAIFNEGFNIDLNIIVEVKESIATFIKVMYINKENYILNSVNGFSKYLDRVILIEKINNICIVKIDNMIMGIEIGHYSEGYYKVYIDYLEWIEGIE